MSSKIYKYKMTSQLYFTQLIFLGLFLVCKGQTIDVEWAINGGGILQDSGRAVSLDTDGNIYFAGIFLPPGVFGSDVFVGPIMPSAFISKVNNTAHWLWSRTVNNTLPRAITNDDSGAVYVAGVFRSSANFGPFTHTASPDGSLFVAKLTTGGTWVWATTMTTLIANCTTDATGIVVNGTTVYISGSTKGTCNYGLDTISTTRKSPLIALLNATDGTWLAEVIVGVNEGEGLFEDLTIVYNSIYAVGAFKGNVTVGSQTLISNTTDKFDILVAKLDLNLTWLWARSAGGPEDDFGLSITGTTGVIYIAGAFTDEAQFGPVSLIGSSLADMYVASLDTNGTWEYAVTNLRTGGVNGFQLIRSVLFCDCDQLFVTGMLRGAFTFGNTTLGIPNVSPFVAIQNLDGTWVTFTIFPSDSVISDGSGYDLAFDSNRGALYNTGEFYGKTEFDNISLTSVISDAYLARMNLITSEVPPETPTIKPPPKTLITIIVIVAILIVILIIILLLVKYNTTICNKCVYCSTCNSGNNDNNKGDRIWNIELDE